MKYKNLLSLAAFIIGLQSCSELEDPAENVDLDTVIQLNLVNHETFEKLDSTSILADSVSSVMLKAVLGEEISAGQVITFTTSHGYLTLPGETNNKVNVQSLSVTPGYREAFVVLHSGNRIQENVLVAAKVGDFTNIESVAFRTSFPEVVNVSPSATVVDSLDTVSFSLEGHRNVGEISEEILYAIHVESDSIVMDVPQYGILTEGEGTFSAINSSMKTGSVEFQIKVPMGESDSTTIVVPIVYK